MTSKIRLGDVEIAFQRKSIKHAHLSVHPPTGIVTLVAPLATRFEVARAFAITKLGWIRKQQAGFRSQARESSRRFVERETHFVWGRRVLLSVRYEEAAPTVKLDHRRITLTVRPGASAKKRAEILHDWHKELLHSAVPPLIAQWEAKMGVKVEGYFLQRMKTKWGSCNRRSRTIRLNTELVKKPKDLLEYVIAHEVAHLVEPTHNERFTAILREFFPRFREARAELNELPLAAEPWS